VLPLGRGKGGLTDVPRQRGQLKKNHLLLSRAARGGKSKRKKKKKKKKDEYYSTSGSPSRAKDTGMTGERGSRKLHPVCPDLLCNGDFFIKFKRDASKGRMGKTAWDVEIPQSDPVGQLQSDRRLKTGAGKKRPKHDEISRAREY